ncbi:MAG TPA: GNAT family N-acetyltransferase [Opitutaceae bacterium]|nr:GNAT family N-acetyltransferase [Opitutaceae bacterium]
MIRFATPADADRISEIHVATWRAAYLGIVPDSFLASMSVEEHLARWRSRIEANPKLVFVHERDGQIDGWVSMGAGRDDDANSDGEVYALYVAAESWRKGTGRALMANAEKELWNRGVSRIVLWVLERNDSARFFYESIGYSPDGRTKQITIGDTVLIELRYEKRK